MPNVSMLLEHITLWTAFKNLSYVAAYLVTVEWLGFFPLSLNVFIGLMIIDVATGVLRAYVVEGKDAVRSALLRRGIVAKLFLFTALFSIALASKGLGYSADNLVQGAVSVLSLGELYSILGNAHSARTGKPKHEFDAVTFLLSRVKELIGTVIK